MEVYRQLTIKDLTDRQSNKGNSCCKTDFFRWLAQGSYVVGGVSSALKAHNVSDNGSLRIENMRARRLTPSECEKLQGLDGAWTSGISDSARYRMIGNGMAQPCADYVMSVVKRMLGG